MKISPLKVNRCFGEIYRIHLQVPRIVEQDTSVKADDKQN
jgi:hypothetical protein